jgi:hypothetical protein
MVEEQTAQRKPKHSGQKEQKQHVELAKLTFEHIVISPESNKVRQDGEEGKKTKAKPVAKKKHKKFIVAEVDAGIHPWTVMIKL